ncbi:MAG TPA: exodeoxyribonuclease VII large subunit [Candidatus Dormibacteraeota bacterium]|nr:exodeoxyribonuclease VII large subunit [Candidatus Dormibacteraeota bacterium]
MGRDEPPDWALPSWDAIEAPEAGSDTSGPGQGRVPGPAHVPTRTLAGGDLRILAVSDVTGAIRSVVRDDERLADLWVEGEVGRVTVSSAGHAYFALRDERSQLQCVWFREQRLTSPFEARTGLRVVAHGRIDLYEPTGALQLYVDTLQPAGFGDLALRLEALKARLQAEGLFDTGRKRSLPLRPSVIAVATSPSGAVWHDIRTVLRRRWPLARVLFVPCLVQGEAAPASIVAALGRIARYRAACLAAGRADDGPAVTIVARGGGSLEDLWPFDDESVVRAVVAHPVPVVSGVGHEVDVTLVDFAADVRAPTPSAAAELVVPDAVELRDGLLAARARLVTTMSRRLGAARQEVATERRALERLDPRAQLAMDRERVGRLLDGATRAIGDRLSLERDHAERLSRRLDPTLPLRLADGRDAFEGVAARLPYLVAARLRDARGRLDATSAALAVLGPQATLDRGYAIVRRSSDGEIVRSASEAPPGTALAIRLARGPLTATSGGGAGEGSAR